MTKAEEIADRIYEKLMQSRRQGDRNLWSGTPEQLRQILAEVEAEVEAESVPCPAGAEPAPAATGGATGAAGTDQSSSAPELSTELAPAGRSLISP